MAVGCFLSQLWAAVRLRHCACGEDRVLLWGRSKNKHVAGLRGEHDTGSGALFPSFTCTRFIVVSIWRLHKHHSDGAWLQGKIWTRCKKINRNDNCRKQTTASRNSCHTWQKYKFRINANGTKQKLKEWYFMTHLLLIFKKYVVIAWLWVLLSPVWSSEGQSCKITVHHKYFLS